MLKLLDGGSPANPSGTQDAAAGLRLVADPAARPLAGVAVGSPIDEIVREGARQMLAAALLAEVACYIDQHAGLVDDQGHRLVVRNGYHQARQVATQAGAVEVRQPRVNDRRTDDQGERVRFSSAILPAWARKSPQVADVLPLLYLHGLSTGDFAPALEQFLGSSAGLSPATVDRLTLQWHAEAQAFARRPLGDADYVYLWVDGVHLSVRLGDDNVCLLVMLGVRADGRKELVALADGYRESADAWADLLRDCRGRGMRAPVLAVGDGALGFWKAARDVFPETRQQKCWFHRAANVLSALPKSVQARATKAMTEIWAAENKAEARKAARRFADEFGVKWPKAAAKITGDLDQLLAFYDYPAEHWVHLRTTNPIESVFSSVKLRTKVTRGAGSRQAAGAMAFKLIQQAETRWRRIAGAHLVPLVRAGAEFKDGTLVERPDQTDNLPLAA
jgi:transposase-like protein